MPASERIAASRDRYSWAEPAGREACGATTARAVTSVSTCQEANRSVGSIEGSRLAVGMEHAFNSTTVKGGGRLLSYPLQQAR